MFDTNSQNQIYYHMNSGNAYGDAALNAFDRSLLSAGCGNYNLLKVSSIIPPGAEMADRIDLKEGALLSTAYARLIAGPEEYIDGEISAAVAVGIPKDISKNGVIMEFSGVCQEQEAKEKAVAMVRTAMADRKIDDYSIKSVATSCKSTRGQYNCALAYVALFEKH